MELELQATVFTKTILHLKDMGFITEDDQKLPNIFISPYLLVCLLMKIGLIGEIYRDYSKQSTTEFFNSLVFLISLTFQSTVAIGFYFNGMKTATFISKISRHKYGVSKHFLSTVKSVEKMTSAIHNYIVYGYVLYIIMNYKTYNECSRFKKDETNSSLYYCGVYGRTWYPISFDFTPVKEIFLAFQVAELVYYIPKISTTIVILYGSIQLTENRIEDLKCFLRDTVVTNREEVDKRLKFAAKKFNEISETVHSMNEMVGSVFSPLQQIILLGLIIFLEFRIIMEKNMESISILIFWSSFEFLICWKGQCLENASSSLMRDVYEFPWYDLHPSSRSLFKIFYSQVQPTLQFKSPPFICFNMRYYHEVIKGSYSVLMFLHRF